MKKINLEPVPNIEPERIVTHLVDNRKHTSIRLTVPTAAKDLACPNCNGKNGFWNLKWNAWACKEDDCLIHWLTENSALKKGYLSKKMKETKK